jgi:hypothetical protein
MLGDKIKTYNSLLKVRKHQPFIICCNQKTIKKYITLDRIGFLVQDFQ